MRAYVDHPAALPAEFLLFIAHEVDMSGGNLSLNNAQ
ncbi:hypothetical protein BHAP_0563 [Bifidobacterium hapali]|uniref:Uncharacterized protein n=1 Tax=Bifidobacterium hapali TaxID=1630172 RepID=A0A261G313_9BIFI|nr:hypothetical protein BHAP_0563 [Bifidobacterium hapali]